MQITTPHEIHQHSRRKEKREEPCRDKEGPVRRKRSRNGRNNGVRALEMKNKGRSGCEIFMLTHVLKFYLNSKGTF